VDGGRRRPYIKSALKEDPLDQKHIRNFSIIAHIDHGKSTLADRILLLTGAVEKREFREQVLDSMDLERERGITIKAQTVRLSWNMDGEDYIFNLIDTPGHVDFSYEVSRSLQACEGAVLVVDASQGVEAQTIANVNLAMGQKLAILTVINKIDLPSAQPDLVKQELEDLLAIDPAGALPVSAKTGVGVKEVLDAVIREIPPPAGNPEGETKALIFDSWFDPYRGVISLVRVVDGTLRTGQEILLMAEGTRHEVTELGHFTPKPVKTDSLTAGDVGYMAAGIKEVREAKIGDTITDARKPTAHGLPGFREAKPMVFAGFYPAVSEEFDLLRDSLEKLHLNDSSVYYEAESSPALGFGFRCGFLGLLHMEIVQERLEREFNLSIVTTAPTVVYRVRTTDGGVIEIHNPDQLPPAGKIEAIEEPYISALLVTPSDYVGPVLQLCQGRRGIQRSLEYAAGKLVIIQYDIPLNEVVLDFHDKLKSVSRGYASFDYEPAGFREGDLVKLDLLINDQPVDALSVITPREKAYHYGRELARKLRQEIPRQMFEVVIQAAIGSRVIARETVKPIRKNVTAKCYGGDITRKRKLLEKQKEGKKRMKRIGRVDVPQEAFLAVLKVGND
jgi:GTP-binding protein LepA